MTKKKLVILTDVCYPVPSAIGRITLQYAKYLKDKYDISIISVQNGNDCFAGEMIDGVVVYTLTQWRLRYAQIAEKKAKLAHNTVLRVWWKSVRMGLRLLGRLQATVFTMDNMWWYRRKSYRLLQEINEKSKIDTILSFNTPIETHLAAYKLKKRVPSVRWVCYWGDLYACKNFKINIFVSLHRMMLIEKKIVRFSDLSLTTEEVKSVLAEHTLENSRLVSVPYGINENELSRPVDFKKEKGECIHFLCMGSFYRKFRNPKVMLEVFLQGGSDYRLDLYTAGECQEVVERYVYESEGRIHHYGLVPYNCLVEKMHEADFLINVENNIEHTNPSKVLELVSYKKPIINFSYGIDKNTVLSKYPIVLNLDSNEEPRNLLIEVEKFVESNIRKNVSEMMIRELYSDNLESSIEKLIMESV